MIALLFIITILVLVCKASQKNHQISSIQRQSVRRYLATVTALVTTAAVVPVLARAAVLAPPALGVDDSGMLRPCPEDASRCVSSQDDRPRCFLAPWEYDGEWVTTRNRLVTYVLSLPGARLVAGGGDDSATGKDEAGRYLRFEVAGTDVASTPSVDDLEFYFTPNDAIVQYRSLRREGSDFLGRENRARIEAIRRALKVWQSTYFLPIPHRGPLTTNTLMHACWQLENITVLRNRARALWFMESPFDRCSYVARPLLGVTLTVLPPRDVISISDVCSVAVSARRPTCLRSDTTTNGRRPTTGRGTAAKARGKARAKGRKETGSGGRNRGRGPLAARFRPSFPPRFTWHLSLSPTSLPHPHPSCPPRLTWLT